MHAGMKSKSLMVTASRVHSICVYWLMAMYKNAGANYNLFGLAKIEGPFDVPILATIFIFQTHLHTFLHTFSPTCISKNYKNPSQTTLPNTP